MPNGSDSGVSSHQSRGWLGRAVSRRGWLERAVARWTWLDRAVARWGWLGRAVAPRGWLGRAVARRWLLFSAAATVVVLVAGVTLAAAGGEQPAAAPAGCSGAPITVAITTSPGTFPVLDKLARTWTAARPAWQGRCLAATVTERDSDQVAAALGPVWSADRGGARPDVWIPESSLWLSIAAARPDAAGLLPASPASVAASPVVLALREPLARALGWPQRTLDWTDVVGALTGDGWSKAGHPEWSSLRMGMTDANRSTAGLAAVLAILDENGAVDLSNDQLVGTLRFIQAVGSVAADTTGFFAAQTDPNSADASIAAFPVMESDLSGYDAANPDQLLVPVYPAQPVVADYPYAVLAASWVGTDVRAAAGQFLSYLGSTTGRDVLGATGLRGPDHSVRDPATLPAADGFPADFGEAPLTLDAVTINQVLSQWTALQRQSNMLVALDTSGSMAQPVAGSALTRLQLMQQTAGTGFGLLTGRNNIGLWDFSGSRPGPDEFRELVPFGPSAGPVGATSRRQAMLGALGGLTAQGSTPLYDTIYAAFHEMQKHWQPDSANAVVVITDGANDLPGGGLTLTDLVTRLTSEQRADQPIQVINIALGPDADEAALQQISQATGGRTFVAADPATAVQTLILAFAGRLS